MRHRRILVYGVTGSGKTTLAKAVAAKTGLSLIDVDELTWEPGWVMVPDDEQTRRIEQLTSGDAWVMDTAYGKWLDIPLARAELIVALDYPRWLSFWRLLRRSLARAVDRKPVCNGNTETLRQILSRDSILAWHFKSFARKRRRMRQWAAEGREVLVMRWPHETQAWLDALPPAADAATRVGTVSPS